jgi:hypothetical protein
MITSFRELLAVPSLLITASILLGLVCVFLFFFLFPAIRLRFQLGRLVKALSSNKTWKVTELQKLFQYDRKLAHLWAEFRDTLHEQKEQRNGQTVVVAWRATVAAEAYFNGQSLVDTRLRTEFFKHFPGIFTGIGIIGTFFGLIQGLSNFDVSQPPENIRHGLQLLLIGVSHAFFVSVTAISLAMLVTFLEKLLLASLYGCAQTISERLDGLFSTGAGEEYLSRLVVASEDSASQSKILKDSLVGDLRAILQDLTEQQIRASSANSNALGQQIAEGIGTTLRAPLQQIGGLVQTAAGDQSKAASKMLEDVMVSFSQRLNELFGGQIGGINELNQRSAQSMQDAVAALHQLVGNIESANQRSGDAMSERLARAMEDMERRQVGINENTQALVDHVRQQVASSQTQTNDRLQALLTDLSSKVGAIVGTMQVQAQTAFDAQQSREEALTARTQGMVSAMGETVASIVAQLVESTHLMQQSVASLERTTTGSIDKMNAGARTLEQGAVAFAAAGERVAGTMERSTAVTSKLAELSGALTSSSRALQSVFGDYHANREHMSSVLAEVRAVVESAKREASMTESTLARMQLAADRLASAQHEADHYLERVSDVLEKAHESFAEGVTRTLNRANVDFHHKLSNAVNLLHSAVAELEVTLSDAAVRR